MTDKKTISIFDPDLQIGQVAKVSLADVLLEFTNNAVVNGQAVQTAVGDFVVIAAGEQAIYGRLVDVFSEGELNFGSAEFMMTLSVSNGKINLSSGVAVYPQTNAPVFLAHPTLVKYIVDSEVGGAAADQVVQLQLAKLYKGGDSEIPFAPERIFGRHCAVLGTSGSGKSWSLARLIEQSARFKSKLILFDATGEFYTLKGGVRHVYIGDDPAPRSGSMQVAIPHYQLKEQDLFAIFRPGGESQPSKLRSAIKTLKLLKLAPALGYNGVLIKAHKEKVNFEKEYRRHYAAVEDPYARLDISRLVQQIENECVFPNRSISEGNFWGGPNSTEHGECVALINRIQDILKSPNLACIFQDQGLPSLLDEIDAFLADPNSRVLRISLQYLSFAYGAREIVANALARRLLEMARAKEFKTNPLVILLDEAHQFLNEHVIQASSEFPLDSFSLIAKEGRKYGLTLCLSTQRPRDIPEGVLSQIGTVLVHRLINHHDRSVVERASGELSSSSLAMLPNLAAGEAIVMGVDFPIPLVVQILPPENKPDSSGPNYQKFWAA